MNKRFEDEKRIIDEKGSLILIPEGKIDSTNADAWEQELVNAVSEAEGRTIVLDFSQVTYISSAGLRVLIKMKRRFSQPSKIRNVSPEVYDIRVHPVNSYILCHIIQDFN